MDLRDFIRSNPEFIFGHREVKKSLNLRAEVRRFNDDPLTSLLEIIDDPMSDILLNEICFYREFLGEFNRIKFRHVEQINSGIDQSGFRLVGFFSK